MIPAANALARILKAEGVEQLICFPTTEIIEACAVEGIRVITARTERVVTNMADAYTRIHNGKKIGVVAVQGGPGVENSYVGIAQAYADSSPVLMLTNGAATERAGLPSLFDAVRNYQGITKWADTINRPDRVNEMMARAFTKLRNGRRRPVLLELPPDVANAQIDETKLAYEPVGTHRSAGDPKDVANAVTLLRKAKKPVFYVGQGVLWAEAWTQLRELAELTQVPVITTTLAKGVFPEEHPLALGICGVELTGPVDHYFKEADLFFCLGASLTPSLAATSPPRGRTIVHCTGDPEDVSTEFRTPHVVVGDMQLVIAQLVDEVKHQGGRPENGAAAEVKSLWDAWLAAWQPILTSDEEPLTPYRIVHELSRTIDRENAILTHDSGTPRAQLAPFYRAPLPRSYLGWGNAHQLGSSLGLIIGAKLAAPEKLCIAFMGDAAFGMNAMDLETAVREQLPVLAIVTNNSWMSTYRNRIPEATDRYKVGYMSGNYAKVAEGLGAHAERVEHAAAIGPALKRAIEATESGTPAVVEFMTKVEYHGSRLGATIPKVAVGTGS